MNSLTEINARQLLGLLANCFDMIDPRLIGHELRSASYADQLLEAAGSREKPGGIWTALFFCMISALTKRKKLRG